MLRRRPLLTALFLIVLAACTGSKGSSKHPTELPGAGPDDSGGSDSFCLASAATTVSDMLNDPNFIKALDTLYFEPESPLAKKLGEALDTGKALTCAPKN